MLLAGFQTSALASNQVNNKDPKDWTFLIYLNGDNNLDSFGAFNINQMEKIGSNDNINIVVQWASLKNKGSQRLLIKKDANTQKVTSPVVQDQGVVDMGDWHSIVDFVQWGVKNYPAKHYFVDVWDHGSGWHEKFKKDGPQNGGMSPIDISWDDNSGNHITTQQLGLALKEAAKIIGHKVDIYASDACLMAMPEVAGEMADSVSVFAGSEETEPGEGWPYDLLLTRWTALSKANKAEPADVAKILVEEYANYYKAKNSAVTFSAFDLSKWSDLTQSITKLGTSIKGLTATDKKKVLTAAGDAQSFAYSDYVDFVDFLAQLKIQKITALSTALDSVNSTASDFVIESSNVKFPRSHGMAVWIPSEAYTLKEYADKYSQLSFDNETHWSDALKSFVK